MRLAEVGEREEKRFHRGSLRADRGPQCAKIGLPGVNAMKLRIVIAFLLMALLAMAQGQSSSPVSRMDTAAMNKSVDPCVDFYQYACGNWIAKNPLPSDRSRCGRFGELQDHNENVELGLLESAAVVKPGRSALEQKIGDYFASCLDTATINKKGMAPLKGELDRIQAMSTEPDGG